MAGRRAVCQPQPPMEGAAIDIVYRITGYDGVVRPGHPLWGKPLPTLKKTGSSAPPETTPPAVTHADYFQAVQTYLTGPGRAHIQKALVSRVPPRKTPPHPDRIEVILEKHGEFYHPSRICVPLDGTMTALALNVAVTPAGGAWMASEIDALTRVANRMPPDSLPTVYGHDEIQGSGNRVFPMFLADWFEGFHEFHLSVDPHNGCQGMVVWDTAAAPFFLSARQMAAVHRQVAFLLTRAFNPRTSEQVYPWHHASGDFILRTTGDAVDLRLITVRQYAPTMGDGKEELTPESRLMALLVFFLNLTVRNRLDRLNGTGPPAWADGAAVPATIGGFFDALQEDLAMEFGAFLRCYCAEEMMELLGLVAERYGLMPLENDVVRSNLAPHGRLLFETLQKRFQMP